jgi:hypothetical protein
VVDFLKGQLQDKTADLFGDRVLLGTEEGVKLSKTQVRQNPRVLQLNDEENHGSKRYTVPEIYSK